MNSYNPNTIQFVTKYRRNNGTINEVISQAGLFQSQSAMEKSVKGRWDYGGEIISTGVLYLGEVISTPHFLR